MDDLKFTSFSTVFQSYQDDGWGIMRGLCNGNPFTIEEILASSAAQTRDRLITRPARNPLSYRGSYFFLHDDNASSGIRSRYRLPAKELYDRLINNIGVLKNTPAMKCTVSFALDYVASVRFLYVTQRLVIKQ